MPGGDRTGPAGMGPMTGGGRGFCGTGHAPRRFFEGGRGRAAGGGGRSWRNWFYAAGRGRRQWFGGQGIGRQEEAVLLKNQAETLSRQLEDIRKRISELESALDK